MPLVVSLILNQNVDVTEIETEQESIAQHFSHIDWKEEQSQDPDIARVVTLLSIDRSLTAQQSELESFEVKRRLQDWDHYELDHRVLYRISSYKGESVKQLDLPTVHRELAFKCLHDDAGHQGRDRTLLLFKTRFHWPCLDKDVRKKKNNVIAVFTVC